MTRSPSWLHHAWFSIGLLAAALLAGCHGKRNAREGTERVDPAADTALAPKELPAAALGNAAHGKELVLQYQCNRCHDGTGHEAAAEGKHCVHCHTSIVERRFKADEATLTRWIPRVADLAVAPSLASAGQRFSAKWIEHYLLQPKDLRPRLASYMPRLPLSAEDAQDIAAYLTSDATVEPAVTLTSADLDKGRRLLDTKGCGACHSFEGVAPIAYSRIAAMSPRAFVSATQLAPDLRITRERMTAAQLVRWLSDPAKVKPNTLMPQIPLSDTEIRDLAGYILQAELAPKVAQAAFVRLPILTRKVTFKEVDEKVFHRTCWHCHSEPDYAIGDGGPGNSGGFGFKPRGLNLSDYAGMAAGYLDDKGERASIFAPEPSGMSRLVEALVARHDEEASGVAGSVRGMPLGYAPLSAEDIQLVESWVAQGRPR